MSEITRVQPYKTLWAIWLIAMIVVSTGAAALTVWGVDAPKWIAPMSYEWTWTANLVLLLAFFVLEFNASMRGGVKKLYPDLIAQGLEPATTLSQNLQWLSRGTQDREVSFWPEWRKTKLGQIVYTVVNTLWNYFFGWDAIAVTAIAFDLGWALYYVMLPISFAPALVTGALLTLSQLGHWHERWVYG